MFCGKCGNELKENELFCSKCGNRIERKETLYTNNEKRKTKKSLNWWQTILATIIAILIGVLAIYIISQVVASIADKERADIHNASVDAGQRNK